MRTREEIERRIAALRPAAHAVEDSPAKSRARDQIHALEWAIKNHDDETGTLNWVENGLAKLGPEAADLFPETWRLLYRS